MNSLSWEDLFGIMSRDKQGRWYPTDPVATEYISLGNYRSPSYKWPKSYAHALQTQKFFKWAIANHPTWADYFIKKWERQNAVTA